MLPVLREHVVRCQVADLRRGRPKVKAAKDKSSLPHCPGSDSLGPGFFLYVRLHRLCRAKAFNMEYYKIGKFAASFGLKGDLVLVHTLGEQTALEGLQALFIENKKGSFLPWFIESARVKNEQEIYVKLEGIDTKEAATPLTRKEVWLPEKDFQQYAAKSAPVSMLGYTIFNGADELGEILEIIEQPHQILCRLEMQGKEVLIPLHEQTLEKVNHSKKQVITALPDGLLEIYLG